MRHRTWAEGNIYLAVAVAIEVRHGMRSWWAWQNLLYKVKEMGRWLSKQEHEARDKEVVRLRTEYGLTYRAIAERLGLHLTQVERAMRKYREDASMRYKDELSGRLARQP